MIIASGPYLSPHFIETLARSRWPVVDAGGAAGLASGHLLNFVDPGEAARQIAARPEIPVLTSGEHALDWVGRNLAGTPADRAARLFKDKAGFRRLLAPLFPGFRFRELAAAELRSYVPDPADYPFVAKPAVGFFSIGVHIVRSPGDWEVAKSRIEADVAAAESDFPEHMLSQGRFLLESYVEGEEFAVDAYFDAEGRPVVLNVMEHRYAGPEDVSDRLYVSSCRVIREVSPLAEQFLSAINQEAGIRNFPLHAEFRRGGDGSLVPIEVNPMRFGGWCTTGDFAHYAWGFNSYELYMNGSRPDWDAVFRGREDSVYGLVVLDNSTGMPGPQIRSFDYDALLGRFRKPLHLSKMDISEFPLFGFLFVEAPGRHFDELSWVLHSDLGEFVERAPAQ